MDLADVLTKLKGVRRSGDGWAAQCPVHDDRLPSLSITQARNGKLLLYCFAGCTYEQVAGALGIPTSGVAAPRRLWRPTRTTYPALKQIALRDSFKPDELWRAACWEQDAQDLDVELKRAKEAHPLWKELHDAILRRRERSLLQAQEVMREWTERVRDANRRLWGERGQALDGS